MKEQELSTNHYDGLEIGGQRLDPMLIYKLYNLHEIDDDGALYHILKAVLRCGKKNSKKREFQAIIATATRSLELQEV